VDFLVKNGVLKEKTATTDLITNDLIDDINKFDVKEIEAMAKGVEGVTSTGNRSPYWSAAKMRGPFRLRSEPPGFRKRSSRATGDDRRHFLHYPHRASGEPRLDVPRPSR